MSLVVDGTFLVSDLRKEVLSKLVEIGKVPEGAPASLVRLREKWNIRAGGLLRDGFTLRQSNVSLVEGREIIVQVSCYSFLRLLYNVLLTACMAM